MYKANKKKKVIARSTRNQVLFSINCVISILISSLIDIIFVTFKNNRGILDCKKCSQDLKYSVFLPHSTFV